MVKALFDTNILVDYLNAVPEARTEFQNATRKRRSVSSPGWRSWLEPIVISKLRCAAF